jgi:hypothetical protein
MDFKTIPVTVMPSVDRIDNVIYVEDFIKTYSNYVDWPKLSKDYAKDVSLDFIRSYHHRFVWIILLKFRMFQEDFLEENHVMFDVDCWEIISAKQNLSESFISKFASKVDWELIKTHQNVSQKFLEDHKIYYDEDKENIACSGASRSV